jgi:hypothetical protein
VTGTTVRPGSMGTMEDGVIRRGDRMWAISLLLQCTCIVASLDKVSLLKT